MSTPAFEIGPATPADLDALERLEALCFDASVAVSRRQFRYLLSSPASSIYVLRHEGRVVADEIVTCRRDRHGLSGRLYSLAVDPACRGTGYGRDLLVHALGVLRAQGARHVALEVSAENVPAIALYESLGFRTAGRLIDYYGPGEDGWRLVLRSEATSQSSMGEGVG